MKTHYLQQKKYFIILFYLLFHNPLYSQQNQSAADIAKTANEFITSAVQSYQQKDFKKSAEMFEKALNVKPGHPFIMYNLAAVSALSGNNAEAIDLLDKLAAMKLVYNPEKDSDFISIWNSPLLQKITAKFSDNNKQTGNCKTAFTLDEHDLITEGINYYPKNKNFYISSIRKRKILSVDKNGSVEDFITTEQDGIWGIFGMAVDKSNGILWVSTSAVPQIQNYNNADSGKTGVFKYDLNKKKLIKKYILADGKNHLFGDLTLNSAGDVFISDSRSNSIYFVDHKKDSLEMFLQSDDLVSQLGLPYQKIIQIYSWQITLLVSTK
jgi:tetratricopeptide (TPR) repeat protein